MTMLNKNEFWRWAYSDFLSNTLRGVLAEFLVSKCIDAGEGTRTEWDAYDLQTTCGRKIEVKSSAYLQTWKQAKPSNINFDIAMKAKFDEETRSYSGEKTRHADTYVFCVFAEKDEDKADPLDTDQWFFIVMGADVLNERLRNQKTVGLATLENIGGKRVSYNELRDAIYNP
jgi:hypothetical protein